MWGKSTNGNEDEGKIWLCVEDTLKGIELWGNVAFVL
jgi:hypothetical protein